MTVSSYHVNDAFQSESTLHSCLNVKELLARSRREIWSLSDCNVTRTHNDLVHKRSFNHLAKQAKWLSCVVNTYLYGPFDCIFNRVTYAFESEATLHSCLIVKELFARSRREICSLSDCNGSRTHNHLVHNRTLNQLVKLAKLLRCVVGTYLYGPFDCMFLSSHVRVSERSPTP